MLPSNAVPMTTTQVDPKAIRLISIFSVLVAVVPLLTYYVASLYLGPIYAAVMAIVMVNMVLFTFVLLSFDEKEDTVKKNQ